MLRANASSSSSSLKKVSPSSSSFKNNKGENIIVVGLGTRGVTIIDELQEGACLPKAQFWSISSDVGILTRTKSTNRWRLPPATSDIPQSAVIDNATREREREQSVLFAAESMSLEAFSSGVDDDDDKKKSKQEKQKELDEKVHICVVCSSGEAGGEAGMLFAKELFKSKNIARARKKLDSRAYGAASKRRAGVPYLFTRSHHSISKDDGNETKGWRFWICVRGRKVRILWLSFRKRRAGAGRRTDDFRSRIGVGERFLSLERLERRERLEAKLDVLGRARERRKRTVWDIRRTKCV